MKPYSDPPDRRDESPVNETAAIPLAIRDSSDRESQWWKQALRQVAVAALRLHHYRYVRTRMFRDALSRGESSQSVCVSRCDQAVNKH